MGHSNSNVKHVAVGAIVGESVGNGVVGDRDGRVVVEVSGDVVGIVVGDVLGK